MKLMTVLNEIKAILEREGERKFSDLRRRDKQAIFDIVRGAADSVMTDGDTDGVSATYYFAEHPEHPDEGILFFAYGEYISESEVRDGLRSMYVDGAQKSDTLAAIDDLITQLN